jgi:hypothetical protein
VAVLELIDLARGAVVVHRTADDSVAVQEAGHAEPLQAIHRQNVKFALAGPVCGNGEWDEYPPGANGDRFHRMAKLADILDGARWGGDYLVLRLQPWTLPPAPEFPWPVAWPDMQACAAKVESRLGAPFYRDEQIVVFALP